MPWTRTHTIEQDMNRFLSKLSRGNLGAEGRTPDERSVFERRACGEEMDLLDQEKDRCSEGEAAFDLQCGESLAIAANRIGKEDFGVGPLLRVLTCGVEAAVTLAYLVHLSVPTPERPSKQSES